MNLTTYKETICEKLAAEGIINKRIIEKIMSLKSESSVDHFYWRLIEKKKTVHRVFASASKKGITLETDLAYTIENLDLFDAKEFHKKINSQLVIVNRKEKCIKQLIKMKVPPAYIQALKNAQTIKEIDIILDKLPPILLANAGLRKTKTTDNSYTKNSIKTISTPMKG